MKEDQQGQQDNFAESAGAHRGPPQNDRRAVETTVQREDRLMIAAMFFLQIITICLVLFYGRCKPVSVTSDTPATLASTECKAVSGRG